MKNLMLGISGIMFGLVAILHFFRFFQQWPAVIGTFEVPLNVSIYAGVVALLLSAGCFIAANKKQ